MKPDRKPTRAARIARGIVWTTFGLALVLSMVVLRQVNQIGPQAPGRPGGFWQPQPQPMFRRPPAIVRPPVSAVPADLPRIQIEIAPKDVETLRGYFWNGWRGQVVNRPEVSVTVREAGVVYTNVALHLKGAAGSFRPFDDKPALTLNFNKHVKGQHFHGYPKVSLNNSVQDSTFLCEALCRELSDAAGIPVPRADWATVIINGRDLGLYVMLEGADKSFLKRYFKNVKGNLYDGGFCQEVSPALQAHSGEHPDDHSDLRRLMAAVGERDPQARWASLKQVLDTDRFISSLAVEVLMCHWDGYAMNRNNYRVYHDLDTDRMVFIPHGMDQMWGLPEWEGRSSPESSIRPGMRGAVARAVMNTPEGSRLYLKRIEALRTNVFLEENLIKRVHALDQKIRPTLAAYDPVWARRHDREVALLCDHIHRRMQSVEEQLTRPKEPVPFDASGSAPLLDWNQPYQAAGSNLRLDRRTQDGQTLLHIAAINQGGTASWRTRVILAPGQYRLEGRARASAEARGGRLWLRLSGARVPGQVITGTDWVPLSYSFPVEGATSEMVLVCEFSGARGEAWFDVNSLRLVRE